MSSSSRFVPVISKILRGKVRPNGARGVSGTTRSRESCSNMGKVITEKSKFSGAGKEKLGSSSGGREDSLGGGQGNWREHFRSIDPRFAGGIMGLGGELQKSKDNVIGRAEMGGAGLWKETFETVNDPANEPTTMGGSEGFMDELQLATSLLKTGASTVTAVAGAAEAVQPAVSAIIRAKNNMLNKNIVEHINEENKVGYLIALEGVLSEEHIRVIIDPYYNRLYVTGFQFKHGGFYPLKRTTWLPEKGDFRNCHRTTSFDSKSGIYTIKFEGFNKDPN